MGFAEYEVSERLDKLLAVAFDKGAMEGEAVNAFLAARRHCLANKTKPFGGASTDLERRYAVLERDWREAIERALKAEQQAMEAEIRAVEAESQLATHLSARTSEITEHYVPMIDEDGFYFNEYGNEVGPDGYVYWKEGDPDPVVDSSGMRKSGMDRFQRQMRTAAFMRCLDVNFHGSR